MNDEQRSNERLNKPVLQYPFPMAPKIGQSIEVIPGVFWIRMPLPFTLNHINIWAIDDGDGWTVIDTGVRTDESLVAWRRWLALSTKVSKPVKRVIVTHMHPDHIGMSGWLTRKFNCRLWMTQLEYLNCRVLISDSGREAPEEALQFYRRAGWSQTAIENYQARFGNFGKLIHVLPETYRRIEDQEELQIGEHSWRVIVGTGHSPEHACLYCKELKIFISGDQVLPKISSNVSVYPAEPEANPMQDWLATLENVKREVPDDVLVLPSHNDCFRGLHSRIDHLADGQRRTLDRLRKTLKEPKRAVDVFVPLFGRDISESDSGLLHLATGESVACLNYLFQRGEVTRDINELGVFTYQALPNLAL